MSETTIKTSIYIDGFNLYHRALKNGPYKWLDLKKLVTDMLDPKHEIVDIKFFTARVSGKFDPQQPIRQQTYIRALKCYIPEISVYYGRFTTHDTYLPSSPLTKPIQFTKVVKTEEKGSDVNLAVHLLHDAWKAKYDCAVLISNDSDLAGPLELVKSDLGKFIGLLSPENKRQPTRDLATNANFVKIIKPKHLQNAQLPNSIPGTKITKPSAW